MAVVELTPSDDGRGLTLDRDDEVILRLPETPTTGFRWTIVDIDPVLMVLDDSFELAPDAKFGSGGIRQIRLRAKMSGTGRLELTHGQAWEGDTSVTDRVSFAITVVGD